MTVDQKIMVEADPVDETAEVSIKRVTWLDEWWQNFTEWWNSLSWWQKALIVTSGVTIVSGTVFAVTRRPKS